MNYFNYEKKIISTITDDFLILSGMHVQHKPLLVLLLSELLFNHHLPT